MAERIQRKRVAGWRMPPGAVSVGRPGRFGNPYLVGDVMRRYPSLSQRDAASFVVNQFRFDLRAEHPGYPSNEEIRTELAGKDLACWCRIGDPCHADVLLAIAAGEEP